MSLVRLIAMATPDGLAAGTVGSRETHRVRRRDDAPPGFGETTDRFAEALRRFDLADHRAAAAATIGDPLP